jgi:hypothetical protein
VTQLFSHLVLYCILVSRGRHSFKYQLAIVWSANKDRNSTDPLTERKFEELELYY